MTIYLNNAATSYPKPKCVSKACAKAIKDIPSSAFRGGITGYDAFEEARALLAELTGIQNKDRVILTQNATAAINTAVFGIGLKDGDTVLTSVTEHNSVLRPLYELEKRGVNIAFTSCDDTGRINADDFTSKAACCKPKLCVFTHASNVTGAVNDAAALAETAKENGSLVLIDASQTAGLYDLSALSSQADMIALTGHKYLLGPQGIGALCISGEIKPKPLLFGGTGALSELKDMPDETPMRLEAGTGAEPAAAALASAIKWSINNPPDMKKLNNLCLYLKEGLKACGAKVIEPEGDCCPVISFVLNGITAEDCGYILNEGYDIICRSGLHCAPLIHKYLKYNSGGTVRLSLSRFTEKKDCDEAIKAVKEIKSAYMKANGIQI